MRACSFRLVPRFVLPAQSGIGASEKKMRNRLGRIGLECLRKGFDGGLVSLQLKLRMAKLQQDGCVVGPGCKDVLQDRFALLPLRKFDVAGSEQRKSINIRRLLRGGLGGVGNGLLKILIVEAGKGQIVLNTGKAGVGLLRVQKLPQTFGVVAGGAEELAVFLRDGGAGWSKLNGTANGGQSVRVVSFQMIGLGKIEQGLRRRWARIGRTFAAGRQPAEHGLERAPRGRP